jgi:hypothetical protein
MHSLCSIHFFSSLLPPHRSAHSAAYEMTLDPRAIALRDEHGFVLAAVVWSILLHVSRGVVLMPSGVGAFTRRAMMGHRARCDL